MAVKAVKSSRPSCGGTKTIGAVISKNTAARISRFVGFRSQPLRRWTNFPHLSLPNEGHMTINKITKAEYPDLWPQIMDDYDIVTEEHRRGSNFFVTSLHTISEEFDPDYPQLWGLWISGRWIRDTEYGNSESDMPDTLYRVEKREVEVTKTEIQYVRVEG